MDSFSTPVTQEAFSEAEEKIRNFSGMKTMSKEMVNETISVFEEIFLRLTDSGIAESDMTISLHRGLHSVTMNLDFEGERFQIDYDGNENFDPGLALLQEYREKISLTYRRGVNSVSIVVKRNSNFITLASLAGLVLAVPVYALFFHSKSTEYCLEVNDRIVFPLLMLFANAMMMISAPVTFFSFVSNMTGCVTLRDRKVNLAGLVRKLILSSLGAMVIAYLVHILFYPIFSGHSATSVIGSSVLQDTFRDTLLNMVPSDIFNAFTVMSPFPLIFLAILNVIAICSMDRYFDAIYSIVKAITDLFCKILSVIILFLPIAAFLSILSILLKDGYEFFSRLGYFVSTVLFGSLLIFGLYIIFLLLGKVSPREFFKKISPSMGEILNINSTIDSVPYLTRFLSRNLKLKRNRLKQELPLLAQLNLDGNCFVLMLASLSCLSLCGHSLSLFQILILTVIILVLSAGAPNQPGSVITGLLIVFYYVDMPIDNFSTTVYMEVLFSAVILILNTVGDMVIVATEQKREEQKKPH